MDKIIVITHNCCLDGFTSLWIAWNKFGKKAIYHGAYPNTKLKDLPNLRGKTVYMFDVLFAPDIMKKIKGMVKKLVVIDHHISNYRKLEDIIGGVDTIFDMNHSAAYLVWKYFNPKKKTPKIVHYVQDNDMGWWLLPYSKEFNTAMRINFPLIISEDNFKKFSKFFKSEKEIKKMIKKGIHYQEFVNWVVKNNIHKSVIKMMDKYKVHVVYIGIGKPISSALATELAKDPKVDFSAVYSISKKGNYTVMLRSRPDSVDVSKVAEKYGGGGHPGAAAFKYSGKIDSLFKKIKS